MFKDSQATDNEGNVLVEIYAENCQSLKVVN